MSGNNGSGSDRGGEDGGMRGPGAFPSGRRRGLRMKPGANKAGRRKSSRGRLVLRIAKYAVLGVLGVHLAAALAFGVLRFVDPPTTGVQIQRRLEALWDGEDYTKRYQPVALPSISPHLGHAVIAAEDGRFYLHHGVDYEALREVIDKSVASGDPMRGASTITQQLVKNLFFTTHRNPVRKAAEFTLAPLADVILGKQRVLELYLNIVEWGPGVFGADAAARYHYGVTPAQLTRDQSARLAACLPSPLRRSPRAMDRYSAIISGRMSQLNW